MQKGKGKQPPGKYQRDDVGSCNLDKNNEPSQFPSTASGTLDTEWYEPNIQTTITTNSPVPRLPTPPPAAGRPEDEAQKFARRSNDSFLYSSTRQPIWYEEIFTKETTTNTRSNRGYYRFHGRPKEHQSKVLEILNLNEIVMQERLRRAGSSEQGPIAKISRKGHHVKWADRVTPPTTTPSSSTVPRSRLPAPLPLGLEVDEAPRCAHRSQDSFLLRASQQLVWYNEILNQETIENTRANRGCYRFHGRPKEQQSKVLEILNSNEVVMQERLRRVGTLGEGRRANRKGYHVKWADRVSFRTRAPSPITPPRLPTPPRPGLEEDGTQRLTRRSKDFFLFRTSRQPEWYREVFSKETIENTGANRGYYKFHGRPKTDKVKILEILNLNELRKEERLRLAGGPVGNGNPNRKGHHVTWSNNLHPDARAPSYDDAPRLPSSPLAVAEETERQKFDRRTKDSFLFRSTRQPPWYEEVFDKNTIANTHANHGDYKIRGQRKEHKEKVLETLNLNELSKEKRLQERDITRGKGSANKRGWNVKWGGTAIISDKKRKRSDGAYGEENYVQKKMKDSKVICENVGEDAGVVGSLQLADLGGAGWAVSQQVVGSNPTPLK